MSDLAATNCGCDNGCGCDSASPVNTFGNNSCSCILWIIILLALCGNNGTSPLSGNGGCGCGDNSCWIIVILLLLCGGCGNGCGNGFF